jgi:hypothetical protein
MNEINLLDFTDRTIPMPGMTERPDLTETAARLNEAALEKLKTAEKIEGSNHAFQEILVALTIKAGVAADVVQSVPLHVDPETPEFQKLMALRDLSEDAGDNVVVRLVEARKETIRADEKGLGDFRKGGPFVSDGGEQHEGGTTTPSGLREMLNSYSFSNKGLSLETASRYLGSFADDIESRAHEALDSIKKEKEEQKSTALVADATATRDRILGPLAEVLREKAGRAPSAPRIYETPAPSVGVKRGG